MKKPWKAQTSRLSLTRADRNFLAYALDVAAARLAEMADDSRAQGHHADIVAKFNTDEDAVRAWILRFDPDYVS